MSPLTDLPRLWPTVSLTGVAEGPGTYWTADLSAMPPVPETLEGSLGWLLREPVREEYSLRRRPGDPAPRRDADAAGLAAVAAGLRLPPAFERFIGDPEPRRRVRSATACYLDLGSAAVALGGGALVHFLSDQQWVMHWLLWVGRDGSEAVVATTAPLGFELDEGSPWRGVGPADPRAPLAVCAGSFEEFLWRYWAMNELFFRLVEDGVAVDGLPPRAAGLRAGPPARPGPGDGPMTLIDHLEAHLGPMGGGWAEDGSGEKLPFQVVWFADAPQPGLVTMATLGLSRHVLEGPSKGVRLELLVVVEARFRTARLLSALVAVGERSLELHSALLRGDIVPMGAPVADGTALDAFYVAPPVALPDSFAVLESTEPPTVFAWLVPIAASEAALAEAHGGAWFEEQLDRQAPDLFDLARAPILHPDGAPGG